MPSDTQDLVLVFCSGIISRGAVEVTKSEVERILKVLLVAFSSDCQEEPSSLESFVAVQDQGHRQISW